MKAIVQREYGSPEVLRLDEVDRPMVGDDQVLVRMKAAGVNPWDWHFVTGRPKAVRLQAGFRRPKNQVPGADGAGIVEAVGDAVTEFSPGDEVWGSFGSAYAEYAVARQTALVPKPTNVSFEAAAATPIAALTALHLRGVAAGARLAVVGGLLLLVHRQAHRVDFAFFRAPAQSHPPLTARAIPSSRGHWLGRRLTASWKMRSASCASPFAIIGRAYW